MRDNPRIMAFGIGFVLMMLSLMIYAYTGLEILAIILVFVAFAFFLFSILKKD